MENPASMVSVLPSKLLVLLSPLHSTTTSSSSSAPGVTEKSSLHILHLIRGCLLLSFHALLFLIRFASLSLFPALSRALHPKPAATSLHLDPAGRLQPPPPGGSGGPNEEGSTYVVRALSQVLAVVTRIPVSSRKYELARGLADRLLEENLHCGSPALAAVNRAALSAAFSRTLRRLESAAVRGNGCGGKADGSVEFLGSMRSRLRLWVGSAEEEGKSDEWAASGGGTAEKLAAEALWLAEKMAACGVAWEAVVRWGVAAGLAQVALASEPRLQGTLVRITAFLFKHASSRELEGGKGAEQGTMGTTQMNMLTSWLPLFCRANNGMDVPVLSRLEKAETVGVLEEIIEKLTWDQQEEVLSLWLHHFTSCTDSDWPDLQPCYTRWYAVSRKLLVK